MPAVCNSSIHHFVAMSSSEDYQDVNRKYRIPGLRDTALTCTTEIDLTPYRGAFSRL